MNKTRQIILWVVAALIIIVGLAAVSVWTITFHPPWEQAETVRCEAETPTLQPGQRLKVLTYNVQYMAGKNYFFFYEGGSDERPSAGDIGRTFCCPTITGVTCRPTTGKPILYLIPRYGVQ
jgi:hypothetical protein